MIAEITPGTLDGAAELLSKAGISVAGVGYPSLAKAICLDSIVDRGPVILVNQKGNAIQGVVLAIVNAPQYFKRFLVRHPRFACRLLILRFSRTKPVVNDDDLQTGEEGNQSAFDIDWDTSRNDVARIVFIAVDAGARKSGIATSLHSSLFENLRQRGIKTVLAQIGTTNHSSLELHRRTEWILGRRGGYW